MRPAAVMQSAPGPETVINGVRYLYFGGTSYLGLAAHPEVIEAGCAAMRQFGVHSATSRDRLGTHPPLLEVERQASEFFAVEDAFYFATGYVSNHILVSSVAAGADALCVESSAHYSVQEAARLPGLPIHVFRGGDPSDLARVVAQSARPLVLGVAVGPASGAVAPVSDYLTVLSQRPRSALLLDDAHGVGVLGDAGRGLLDELGLWHHANGGPSHGGVELYVTGTLAKALGGFGGIIPGTEAFVSAARSGSHYFEGASAPASACAGASAKALEIARRNPALRESLRKNGSRLRDGLRKLGLEVTQSHTAHFGLSIGTAANMRRIHEALKIGGILLPYLASYSGTSQEGLLRFAVFANHTPAQIDQLLAELAKVL